ncbi:MAG: hypothetical protein ACE3L7_04040 [Candidatus Pristimantibacillus sp.]
MNKSEVIELMAEIKENYSSFDVSDEEIERHYKYLKDFPFESAMKNVFDHIQTSNFVPKISEIRGRLGDKLDSQHSKKLAASYELQLAEWAKDDRPPPEAYWERIKTKLRGEQA